MNGSKTVENLTIVTGIWDLGRENAGTGFQRSFQHYLDNFAKLLQVNVNMVIYIDPEYEQWVWERRSSHNTRVYVKSAKSFETSFDFYAKVQAIRTSETWLKQAEWLRNSAQATLPLYNPVVMSKYFLLHDQVCINPFNTDYFAWIDGGITNTIHPGYFTADKIFEKLPQYLDTLLFLSFPYPDGAEIHGLPRPIMNRLCGVENVEYVCRGGLFGGHRATIREFNSIYYYQLAEALNTNWMGTEECIFTILAHHHPLTIRRISVEANGLLSPFFEQLKATNSNLPLHRVDNSLPKVSLYILTFNSPAQVTRLLETWSINCDGFDQLTKYLIDNSTDPTHDIPYDKLCTEYNLTRIKKDNIGVCGGRQFAAEHFDTTDADYYIFLEDDMLCNGKRSERCVSGFSTYVSNFYNTVLTIMRTERLDFLKFSFSEFFGTNKVQWAWYNVPQDVRVKLFPENPKPPVRGPDPNAPLTRFTHINTVNGTSYALGEIYYCNWPQIVSRSGNKKMFLETKWAHPFEQTWMSHIFQETRQGKIKSGVLLASPITHHRFDHYPADTRREN